MLELRLRINLPVEGETVLHWNPDFLIIEVLDSNLVLNGSVFLASTPLPCQAEPGRGGIVDEGHSLVFNSAGLAIESPMYRGRLVRNIGGCDQSFRRSILPRRLPRNGQGHQARSRGPS